MEILLFPSGSIELIHHTQCIRSILWSKTSEPTHCNYIKIWYKLGFEALFILVISPLKETPSKNILIYGYVSKWVQILML